MNTIPFEVPAKFLVQVALGKVVRYGTVLKNVASGEIVGHLQEGGRLSTLLCGGLNPIVQATQLATSVAANVQLEEVKKMLGTLQLVTGATLVVSALGIGISIAGFAVVSRKLDRLETQVGQLESALQVVRGDLHVIDLRQRARDRAAILSLMALGDEAWKRRDKEDVWRELAQKLSVEENYYRALLAVIRPRGESVINDSAVAWVDAIAAHEALAHLVAARTKCLLLLNELEAADHYSSEWRDWLRRNFRDLTPPAIVDKRWRGLSLPGDSSADRMRMQMLDEATDFTRIVREQQEFADSTPELVSTLIARRIDGRSYVEQLNDEKRSDLVVLEAAA